jgi:hypothetical protein
MSLEKPIQLTTADLAEIARQAADRAARRVREEDMNAAARIAVIAVLQELGLADEDGRIGTARDDIIDLRDLMQTLRMVKRRVRALMIVILFALLTPLIISHLKAWL